jgi:hypothetical protein
LVMFFQLGRICAGISGVKVHGGKLRETEESETSS